MKGWLYWENLIAAAAGLAVVGVFFALLIWKSWWIHEVHWLKDNGEVAIGLIVDGHPGTSTDNTDHCTEHVEFTSASGSLRRTTRECLKEPALGALVTVRYSPDDHAKTFVEGDYRYGEGVVLVACGLLGLAWAAWLLHNGTRPEVQTSTN